MGSSIATTQGAKIFETLNKCIVSSTHFAPVANLNCAFSYDGGWEAIFDRTAVNKTCSNADETQVNSWDRYLTRSSAESLSMIQASLLGQTFAILSGVPARLNLAQAYHGTILAWARQGKLFKEKPGDLVEGSTNMDPTQLDRAWRSWAESQQRVRLVLGLQIHDAELAIIFHHEPLLRHEKESSRHSTSEQLFNAISASSWWVLAKRLERVGENLSSIGTSAIQKIPRMLSAFDGYARLSGIAAAICESRQQNLLETTKQSFFISKLLRWQQEAKDLWKDQTSDPHRLTILWHSTFISVLADCETMECAIGKDGVAGVSQAQSYIIEWASSSAASRCLIHAFCLQKRAELIQYGHESAIHVPRCLFQAAYIWYLFSKHSPSDSALSREDFPEFQQISTTLPPDLFQRASRRPGNNAIADLSTLYTLKDLLQRVGRWGLSKRYASILGFLIEGDVNSFHHT